MTVEHEWQLIEDLPSDWATLCRDDLRAVHEQWVEERALLKDPAKVRQFQDRLATLWAIETGIIEKLYTVDRGVTIALVEVGLDALGRTHASGQISREARSLIADQREALEMVMDLVGGQRELTDSYIKELHHRLTLSQDLVDGLDQFGNHVRVPLLNGQWKRAANNPTRPDGEIHEYTPWEFVQDEIDNLVRWHREHESNNVCPEVEAAWLHHRFTQVHPFQDGNGRVARAITAGVFLKHDYLTLVVRDTEHRESYLVALETADRGDLKPLVDLFADIQIADLQEAITFVRSLRGETVLKVAESAALRARRRQELETSLAERLTADLAEVTYTRLDEVAAEVERAFELQGVRVLARAFPDQPETQDYWSTQIVETAQREGYYADLRRFRRWVRLRLRLPDLERVQTNLLISFHAIGRAADLRAVAASLSTSALPADEDRGEVPADSGERWELQPIGHSFRYRPSAGSSDEVMAQYKNWLEDTVAAALDLWAERL